MLNIFKFIFFSYQFFHYAVKTFDMDILLRDCGQNKFLIHEITFQIMLVLFLLIS